MNASVGFIVFLVITLACLTGAVVTGRAARRKLHLRIVTLTVISLVVTIYYAEQLGKLYDLESAGWIYPFHLLIAKVASASYLIVIASGYATIKNTARRKTHATVAYSVIALTVLTAVTGAWMVFAATQL